MLALVTLMNMNVYPEAKYKYQAQINQKLILEFFDLFYENFAFANFKRPHD